MKLTEIKLLEAYKEPIGSIDDVIALLTKHCSNAITPENLAKPIVRGMTGHDDYLIITGEDGERKSANTSNHYTKILDEVLPSEYPKRSKSIICGNVFNKSYAASYGTLYAILPYDETKIAFCKSASDIFDIFINIGDMAMELPDLNIFYKQLGINDSSYEEILDGITKNHEKFGLPDDREFIDKELHKIYTKPFDITTTANPTYNAGGKARELWIGGKCIAVKWSKWIELIEYLY